MTKESATEDATESATASTVESTVSATAEKTDAVKLEAIEASDAAAAALKKAQESMPEGVDLGKISGGLDGVFGSATDALDGITDVESAQNAIPALEEATSKLGGLSDVITRLPDAAKGPVGGIVSGGLGLIQPMIEKVSAIPGVGAVIEPVVAPLMEMLNGLAG